MNWKIKAFTQKILALLPNKISLSIYYLIQRKLGELKMFSPESRLVSAAKTWDILLNNGYSPSDKVFFEIGTGRVPIAALAFWLMGCSKTITFDLNPYVKRELIIEALQYIFKNQSKVRKLLAPFLVEKRFQKLCRFNKKNFMSSDKILKQLKIFYYSPADAAKTALETSSIDYYISHAVFEHIPINDIYNILNEANRIIKNNGAFVHWIDYSDHFSHSDSSISALNFLKYNRKQWNFIAGNKFMYMNRLRHDDFVKVFKTSKQKIIKSITKNDKKVFHLLKNKKIKIHKDFDCKSKFNLQIRSAWFLLKKANYKN